MKTHRVFAKITPVLGFKHIWYQHENNQSFGKNVELMKNIADIKGEKTVKLKSKVQSHIPKDFLLLDLQVHDCLQVST